MSEFCPRIERHVQERLVALVRMARGNDFLAGVAEEIDTQRVAVLCGIADPRTLRIGLRSLLCSACDDWKRFDALFDACWYPGNVVSKVSPGRAGVGRGLYKDEDRRGPDGRSGPPDMGGVGDVTGAVNDGPQGGASARESLERADFHTLTDASQMRTVERLAEALARRMRRRICRRERDVTKRGRISLRQTMRVNLRHGGTPLRLAFRRRRRRQPRLIVITDVSRSMAMYSYFFLRFARGLVGAFRDAHAFAFHTRLVPITDALRRPNPVRAAEVLELLSKGWFGGTRLGESLLTFNRNYGRLLSSNSRVILISDGLDTGDPELLGRQLQCMRARCRHLAWLNPLLGRPGYEPKTGAMLAALPHLDLFAPAHNLESLAALEPTLTSL